jgi:hypothetical protein
LKSGDGETESRCYRDQGPIRSTSWGANLCLRAARTLRPTITLTFLQQYTDRSFSLTDYVSFVVMRQRGVERALAFDRHFIQAGFQKLP